MASCCAMFRTQTLHACVESKLAPAIFCGIAATLAQIEMPAHWFSFRCSEFQALEFFRNLGWFFVSGAWFLQRLRLVPTSMVSLSFVAFWMSTIDSRGNARQCNQVHINSRIVHQTQKNSIQRWWFVFLTNEGPTELRCHDVKKFHGLHEGSGQG